MNYGKNYLCNDCFDLWQKQFPSWLQDIHGKDREKFYREWKKLFTQFCEVKEKVVFT